MGYWVNTDFENSDNGRKTASLEVTWLKSMDDGKWIELQAIGA